ncbi:MAG: hypothetical protein V2A34_01650 [Lentisphaerota bacterium]
MKRWMFLISGFLALGGVAGVSIFFLTERHTAFHTGIMAQSFLVSFATTLGLFWLIRKRPSTATRLHGLFGVTRTAGCIEVVAEGFSISLVSGDDIGVMEEQLPYRTGQEFDLTHRYHHDKPFSNAKSACVA